MSEWKLMDDGAKDGSEVLAWVQPRGAFVVKFKKESPNFPWCIKGADGYFSDTAVTHYIRIVPPEVQQ